MNKLFEEFVGNLLEKRLEDYDVELQKTEHPEKTGRRLIIKLDIMLSRNGVPLFIIDTKYQKFSGNAEVSHLEQLCLYSNTTHVKNCALVYIGKSRTPPYDLEEDITVHIILFDLEAENEDAFKYKCDDFMDEIRKILNSLNDKKPRG